MSRSTSFIIEGEVDTLVIITEQADGSLLFQVEVLGSGSLGDLRGLFFDLDSTVARNSLMVDTVSGGPATDVKSKEGSIASLGGDANIKGAVTAARGNFDVGVEIGTPGMARDDIQEVSFVLSSRSGSLSLDDLSLQDFGVRLSSVEAADGTRTTSAKLGGDAAAVAQNDTLETDENENESVSGGGENLISNDQDAAGYTLINVFDGDGNFTPAGTGFERLVVVEVDFNGVTRSMELGTLMVDAAGNAVFDANGADADALQQGQPATYQFGYTTSPDGGSTTSTAMATLTVTGQNDAPTIVMSDLLGAVTENATMPNLTDTGTIAFADVDLLDSHTVSVTNASTTHSVLLGALTPTVTSQTSSADGTGGTVTWNYSVLDAAVQFLGVGQTITETFTVTINDGNSGTVSRDVAVTITGTNDAPTIAVADLLGAVTEDAAMPNLTDAGTIAFEDMDVLDSHTVAVVFVSASGGSQRGSLTASVTSQTSALDGAGGVVAWNYSVSNADVQDLGKNDVITETYAVTIDDGNMGTVTRNVVVTIDGRNDAPVVTGDVAARFNEDDNVVIVDLLANASDVDRFDDLDIVVNSFTPSNLARSVKPGFDREAGTMTLSTSPYQSLAVGESETLTISYDVVDGNGGITPTRAVITIEGRNDAPSVDMNITGGDRDQIALSEDGSLTGSETLSVMDVDTSDIVTASISFLGASDGSGGAGDLGSVSVSDLPGLLSVSPMPVLDATRQSNQITYSFAAGSIDFSHLANREVLLLSYRITVVDPFGVSDFQDVSVEITGTNSAPVVQLGADVDVPESDTAIFLSKAATVEDPDGDNLQIDIDLVIGGDSSDQVNQAAMLSAFSVASDGQSYEFDSGADTFDFLSVGQSLTLDYTVEATDPTGLHDTDTVRITIDGTNDAPALDTLSVTTNAGNFNVANSADIQETNSNLNARGALSLDHPDLDDALTFKATIRDAILISPGLPSINRMDLVSKVSVDITGPADSATFGTVVAWDFNTTDPFDFLRAGESLIFTYDITATDSTGAISNSERIGITINGTNDAPVAVPDVISSAGALNITEDIINPFGGVPLELVLTNDTDPDSLTLALSPLAVGTFDTSGTPTILPAIAQNGTVITEADGTFLYVPNADFGGTDLITYAVTDNEGGVSIGQAEINVIPVADTPDLDINLFRGDANNEVRVTITGIPTDVDGSETVTIDNRFVGQSANTVIKLISDEPGLREYLITLDTLTSETSGTPPILDSFQINVIATATESGNGDTAQTMASAVVEAQPLTTNAAGVLDFSVSGLNPFGLGPGNVFDFRERLTFDFDEDFTAGGRTLDLFEIDGNVGGEFGLEAFFELSNGNLDVDLAPVPTTITSTYDVNTDRLTLDVAALTSQIPVGSSFTVTSPQFDVGLDVIFDAFFDINLDILGEDVLDANYDVPDSDANIPLLGIDGTMLFDPLPFLQLALNPLSYTATALDLDIAPDNVFGTQIRVDDLFGLSVDLDEIATKISPLLVNPFDAGQKIKAGDFTFELILDYLDIDFNAGLDWFQTFEFDPGGLSFDVYLDGNLAATDVAVDGTGTVEIDNASTFDMIGNAGELETLLEFNFDDALYQSDAELILNLGPVLTLGLFGLRARDDNLVFLDASVGPLAQYEIDFDVAAIDLPNALTPDLDIDFAADTIDFQILIA